MWTRLPTYRLPVYAFIITAVMLCMVQWKVARPILLAERFIAGAGWLQILVIAGYAAWITKKMEDPSRSARWRRITWTIFTVVFFGQFVLGLAGYERFLMTGKLHLPIPAMILSGPLYRGELSIMSLLFVSTIVLSGPAWCSHLCYFGAVDNLFSTRKKSHNALKHKNPIKFTLLAIIVIVTLVLRWYSVPIWLSTVIGLLFGVMGLAIIVFFSRRRGKMVHCVLYCPIGTLVQYGKYINPFRLKIDKSCTLCMKCTSVCKYDALNIQDIKYGRPGQSCTLCGDCLQSCHVSSFQYQFLTFSPTVSRNLYLFITVSLHAIFLALSKI